MATIGRLLIVITDPFAGVAIGDPSTLVVTPMTIWDADSPNETGVPAMVTGAAPGATVRLPTTNCEAALAVIGCRLRVMTAAAAGETGAKEGKATVLPPSTMFDAEGPREISVLATVIFAPPGWSVWLPTTY